MRDGVEGLRRVDPGYRAAQGKIRFSKTEILHIAAAIAVLSAAFTAIMRDSSLDPNDPTMNLILIAGVSVMLVVCSFLAHEFGHKFVAQRYNVWSEFRAYPTGLILALFMSFLFGFLFAAPGAVYIRGNIDREMNGKISLAGPAVNFTISAIAIWLCFFMLQEGTLAYAVIKMLAFLNAFLGLFNMLPVAPFDGSKIVAWNIPIYVIALIIGALELAGIWFFNVI